MADDEEFTLVDNGEVSTERHHGRHRWLGAAHADQDRLPGAHRADGLAGTTRRYLLIVGLLAGTASLPLLATIGTGAATTVGEVEDRSPFIEPPTTGPVVVPVPSPDAPTGASKAARPGKVRPSPAGNQAGTPRSTAGRPAPGPEKPAPGREPGTPKPDVPQPKGPPGKGPPGKGPSGKQPPGEGPPPFVLDDKPPPRKPPSRPKPGRSEPGCAESGTDDRRTPDAVAAIRLALDYQHRRH